jgi:hypothetical protein
MVRQLVITQATAANVWQPKRAYLEPTLSVHVLISLLNIVDDPHSYFGGAELFPLSLGQFPINSYSRRLLPLLLHCLRSGMRHEIAEAPQPFDKLVGSLATVHLELQMPTYQAMLVLD